MEHQTSEHVDLYARRAASPGKPLPIKYGPLKINNGAPLNKEIRLATSELSNGPAAGASGMCAEHVKDWLQGVQRKEDLDGQGAPGDGDNWQLIAHLVQAALTYSIVPCPLLWIIVILIPKGGRDYHGIELLELIWKVIKRMINHRLDTIQLHDSLHGCQNKCGTGIAIVEAKLAQQLSYLELQPYLWGLFGPQKSFQCNGQGTMPNDSRGIRGRPRDDPVDTWLLA
jgi:hypothetical protein